MLVPIHSPRLGFGVRPRLCHLRASSELRRPWPARRTLPRSPRHAVLIHPSKSIPPRLQCSCPIHPQLGFGARPRLRHRRSSTLLDLGRKFHFSIVQFLI
ncbi:hypothetical protein D1007_21121 [Hordeum vulgare]|nr:hypothetical protein D1007_21121 [Hordeum vulgare]